ncbi:MAG: LmeA family phospholipid-binding protein [Chthonomonadales bacterium]
MIVLILLIPAALLLAPGRAPVVLTAAQKQESVKHLDDVKSKITEIKLDQKQKKTIKPYQLRMTEQDINTFIGMDEQVKDIITKNKLEDVFVKIESGQIKAYGSRYVRGVMMHGTLEAVPTINDQHRLAMKISALKTGSLGLPQGLAAKLTDEFSDKVLNKLFDPGLKLNTVEIESDAIVVTGDSK